MTMGIGFYPTAYVGQRPLQLVGVCPKEAVRGGNNRIINPLALATRGRAARIWPRQNNALRTAAPPKRPRVL